MYSSNLLLAHWDHNDNENKFNDVLNVICWSSSYSMVRSEHKPKPKAFHDGK